MSLHSRISNLETQAGINEEALVIITESAFRNDDGEWMVERPELTEEQKKALINQRKQEHPGQRCVVIVNENTNIPGFGKIKTTIEPYLMNRRAGGSER